MTSKTLSKPISTNQTSTDVKPMPLWLALIYFGIPALGVRLFLYNGIPALIGLGLTPFHATVVSYTVPMATLFACAFGFAKFELQGRPMTWSWLRARFRLQRMNRWDWLWMAVGFVAAFLGTGMMAPTSLMFIQAIPPIAPPDFFPALLNPVVTSNPTLLPDIMVDFVGAPLSGNWSVLVLGFVMVFFNVMGEELWWRGLILPRQEQAHGRWTWLVHGLMWLLFHLPFYPWRALDLLPYCLIIPFIAQRRRNSWPGIIIHWQNGLFLLVLLAMVLGIG